MSVTFWCPDAPRTKSIPYPDIDPEFEWEKSVLPEIQLANTNARAALEMLGASERAESYDGLVGLFEVKEFDELLARLRSFLACSVERAALLEPVTVNGRVAIDGPVRIREPEMAVLDMDAPAPRAETELIQPAEVSLSKLLQAQLAGHSPLLPPPQQTVGMLIAERRRGPTMISFGRNDAYLRETAERFLELFTVAKEHGYQVTYG